MSSILEAIRNKFATKRGQAEQSYQQLVANVADGLSQAQKDAESVLLSAGKSVDDLAADVEALTERRKLIAEAARLPEMESERESARVALLRARKALDDWNRQSKIDEQEHAKALANAEAAFQRAADAVKATIEIRNSLSTEEGSRPTVATSQWVDAKSTETANV